MDLDGTLSDNMVATRPQIIDSRERQLKLTPLIYIKRSNIGAEGAAASPAVASLLRILAISLH